jgi:predicted kinase
MLILVFGLPGSGKTYFASHLAKRLNAVHLSSDIVRQETGAWNKYSTASKESVYDALFEETRRNVLSGNTVVVDATFYRKKHRDKFIKEAKRLAVRCKLIEVRAMEKTIRQRVSKPRADSQADFEVYKKIKGEFEPVTEDHLVLFSDKGDISAMLVKAAAYLMDD